jgi:hypothetical protein
MTLVIFVLIVANGISLSQDTEECQGSPKVREPSYRSFFGNQVSLAQKFDGWEINLVRRTPSSSCPSSYRFIFQAANLSKHTKSELTLCNETVQVDEIDIINSSKVLLLGRVAANAPVANVIDIAQGGVLDHFLVFMPAVSPSHRYLAFVQSFPGHPGPLSVSAEYMVYDLTQSPGYNRPSFGTGTSEAGWPIYPPGATGTPGSNLVPEGVPYHLWTSQALFWIESDQLAFADFFERQNKLIVVNLSGGIKDRSIVTIDLDPARFVDLSQCSGSYSRTEFEELSEEAAGLIRVGEIDRGKEGRLCLKFVHNPCLRSTEGVVKLP